ncbi:isochorismate synthase MenF [Microbacterium sp. NPDC055910]|uniref:isochorismate synthase n=1 Tax=Microbacterium sp. NPDC055910 TaxID=3345659 RepID=UPI0035D5764A
MTPAPRPPKLVVETREIDPIDDLVPFADPREPLAWLRRGDGIIGLGQVTGYEHGPQTPPDAPSPATAWRLIAAEAEIDDAVGVPGTGLVAFGTLVFDARSQATSLLTVPEVVVGRRDGRAWVTRIRTVGSDVPERAPEPIPFGPHWSATLGPGALDRAGYQAAVRAGLDAISTGEVAKVVLARDLVGTVPAGADLRRLVRALATDYPDTWTYAVDGMIGASPETLVTVSGGTVTARVLAGTTPRGADATEDATARGALAASAKDLDEHRYAVRSVLETLAPHTSTLRSDPDPFTLELPNLWHLATDVAGEIADHASALDLVAALHPTAAVAGTPTDAALDAIHRIEPFDRGRYAGPVGWVDANGDGEWAIALRCAQIGSAPDRRFAAYSDTIPIIAYAGAGIVAGSDPEAELLETRVKFRPIVDALA